MKSTPEGKLSFEEALEQLEDLVTRMEAGDTRLDDLVKDYERGNELLAICAARLRDAERRIQLLQQDRKGVSLVDFDPDKT